MSHLPIISPKKLIKALGRKGFTVDRQHGSHVIMKNTKLNQITCIPMHSGDISKKLLSLILKQIHMSKKDLIELL